MKKLIIPCLVGMLVWTALIIGARAATPVDHCGYHYKSVRVQCSYKYTKAHGYVVQVTNDLPVARIHASCGWDVRNGRSFGGGWYLDAGQRGWYPSDLGSWGSSRPLDVHCNWFRLTTYNKRATT